MATSIAIKATGPAMAEVVLQRIKGELKAMGAAASIAVDGDTILVTAPRDVAQAVWRALKATPPIAVAEIRLAR